MSITTTTAAALVATAATVRPSEREQRAHVTGSIRPGTLDPIPDLHGRPFTPTRVQVDYRTAARLGAGGALTDDRWTWSLTVYGELVHPAPGDYTGHTLWAATGPDMGWDHLIPADVAEFIADQHPGCRRDHIDPTASAYGPHLQPGDLARALLGETDGGAR